LTYILKSGSRVVNYPLRFRIPKETRLDCNKFYTYFQAKRCSDIVVSMAFYT